jgi:pimeloyl-ACP methyl ester carboxylesterase
LESSIFKQGFLAFLTLINLLMAQSVAQGQEEKQFPKGIVIERVVSINDPTKTYALYLPKAYSAAQKFSILYCFDPLARGAVPVTRFKDAAEKYNYIVVGSNNSRNGPNQLLNEIILELWSDTHARLSIDDKRVYVAGFSGGARVAISVGFWLKDRIAGVIACGGGFPSNVSQATLRSFVLFETTGTEDFNNPEMQSLYRSLEGSLPSVRLAIFEGGHTWLPEELASEALEWLELQAMKSGIRERDLTLVNSLFEQALIKSRSAEESKDLYRAYLQYAAIAMSFEGLHDVTEIQKKVNELKTTKEVRDGIKREKEMADEQSRRIQNIHGLVAGSNGAESLVELRNALRDQRKIANATEASVNRTVARRVMESLLIECFERGNAAMAQKNYGRAITNFVLTTEIQPDNPGGYYYLARAYALNGEKKDAIAALQSAAEKGFARLQDLSSQDFAELQTDKRFQEILELVRKNQNGSQ